MILIHVGEHLETVQPRHNDIQQHQRNARSELMYHGKRLFAAACFHNAVIAAEDLAQNLAVHIAIIHNQDKRLHAVLCLHAFRQSVVGFNHDLVFRRLGMIEQPVGPADGAVHRLVFALRHAADADAHAQMRAFVNDRRVYLIPNLFQLLFERLFGHVRQNQQKLVAAKTNQAVALADVPFHHVRHDLQRGVSAVVTVCIVVDFEIVQIHNGHAGRAGHVAGDILIVTAVVNARQRVMIELGVVAGHLRQQVFALVRFHDRSIRQELHGLQHIRLPFDLHILRRNQRDIPAEGLNFAFFPFFIQCRRRNAFSAWISVS